MTDLLLDDRVKELIPEENERENLFDALRRYQSSQDLLRLIKDLRIIIDEPKKLELFEFLRPLILLRHQIPYSQRVPPSPGSRLHLVRLQRQPRESLGFAVRGGYEHGVGIFVTAVTAGSQAHRQGLKVGDQIVRVNGFTISEAVHEDVLRLIKSRDDIILKVMHIGMIPCLEKPGEVMTWKYVDDLSNVDENSDKYSSDIADGKRSRDIKIFIDSTGHASIGCTIISERGHAVRYHGIFVEKVRPGSLADEVGLQPGDQILEVNSTSFRGITWEEAKLALKSSRQLHFIIRKNSLPVSKIQSSERRSEEQQILPAETSPVIVPTSLPSPTVHQQPMATVDKRSMNHPSDEVQDDRDSLMQYQQVINTSAQVHVTSSQRDKPDGNLPPNTGSSGYREAFDQQSSPLGGAAAAKLEQRRLQGSGKSGNSPRLLELEGEFGWTDRVPQRIYDKLSSDVLDGKLLKCLSFQKTSELGIAVEGGLGSPLGGKILVSMIFEDGVAHRSDKLRIGDQLMMVNGRQLFDVTLSEAEGILRAPTKDNTVELLYCESNLVNDEDSVTYF